MRKQRVHSREIYEAVQQKLAMRGVMLDEIAEVVLTMQRPYNPKLTMKECMDSVLKVLEKRELQHALLVGIELDILTEKGLLSEPLQSLLEQDEGLFGIDETLAIGACNVFGSIACTTFGHLDKQKFGVIKRLDTKSGKDCHTFMDDMVAMIASCAAARIAHKQRDNEEEIEAMEQMHMQDQIQSNA